VIVQFGGQTPLNIANELAQAGVKSWAPRRKPSTWPKTATGFA
jgi:hypothetical protein